MIKYVFLDFNGTILDDVDLCMNLLNDLLFKQNRMPISKDKYKNIFGFPVKDYYIKAGLSFDIEPFEILANRFIDNYKRMSPKCGLYSNVIDTLNYLKNKNIHLILLSASEYNMLINQCNYYNITSYFDDILGTDNIYAESKSGIGNKYITFNYINRDECVFVGDTNHDYLISKEMGIKSVLVTYGHQSRNVLEECDSILIDDISAIKEII